MLLTLAIPRLLTLDRALLRAARPLARIARWAGPPSVTMGGLDAALLIAAGAAIDTPVAPLAALGAGFDPGDRYVLRADPIALIAGRDDVLLAGRVDDLTATESAALVATLNGHFAGDGLVFHAPRPDAWFATFPTTPRLTTTPLSAVHGATYPHQPSGDDAKAWRQWLSEMQMLLHEHPVNVVRERSGGALVTGIWIDGGGRLVNPPDRLDAHFFATPGAAGDVARGLAHRSGLACSSSPAGYAALRGTKATIVVLAPLSAAEEFTAIAAAWLDPAVDALEGGELASFTLLATGEGSALGWHARRPSLLARIRARVDQHAFEVPAEANAE